MAKRTSEWGDKNITITKYEMTNDRLNALIDSDEVVYIVQGPNGRVPIPCPKDEENVEEYVKRRYVAIQYRLNLSV